LKYIKILILLSTIASFSQSNFSDERRKVIDSIVILREQSKNKTSFTITERFSKAERARRLSNDLKIDSTIILSNRRVASLHKEMKNYNLFKKLNRESLILAKKSYDSISIGNIHFSLGYYFYQTLENDSAFHHYYSAEKIYRAINENFNAGRVLKNMAVIQKNEKDFIGSETTSINALKLIEPLAATDSKFNQSLSGIYNNLAIVSKELEQYENAIDYYNKAINTLKKFIT